MTKLTPKSGEFQILLKKKNYPHFETRTHLSVKDQHPTISILRQLGYTVTVKKYIYTHIAIKS